MNASELRVNNTSNGQKPLNCIPNMQTVLVTKAELNFSLGISFPPPGTTATAKYFFKLYIYIYKPFFFKRCHPASFQLWTQMDGVPISHEWVLIHCSSSCLINKMQSLVTEKMQAVINHLSTSTDFPILLLVSEHGLSLRSPPWIKQSPGKL